MAKNKPNRGRSALRLLWFASPLAVLRVVPAAAQAPPSQTVLFNFAELPNGRLPYGGVIGDAHGNLFGTAASGGRYNSGLVYKVDSAGKGTILFNFAGGSDGSGPQAGVILDSAGNLYGTTEFGGTGFTNWTRRATKRCCTASPAEPTENTPCPA
jgi:uncharacterized repeat protein (TIGR03803 family)